MVHAKFEGEGRAKLLYQDQLLGEVDKKKVLIDQERLLGGSENNKFEIFRVNGVDNKAISEIGESKGAIPCEGVVELTNSEAEKRTPMEGGLEGDSGRSPIVSPEDLPKSMSIYDGIEPVSNEILLTEEHS